MTTPAKEKINKRLSYFTKAIKPKEVRLWAKNDSNTDTSIFGMLTGYLEWRMNIPRIDIADYDNDFKNFYDMEIAVKYDGVEGKEDYYFCSTEENGGVDENYIQTVANEPTNATLMSVSLNPDNSINTIYALVTFRVSESKMAIKIHTLCGNQTLPPSGEGTRLMKMLETAGHEFGLHKILLNPIDTALKFYADNKYRLLRSNESRETPDSSSSGEKDDDASEEFVMQKNVRAQKHWAKLRNAVNVAIIMKKQKKATKRLQLEKKHAKLAKERESSKKIKLDPMTLRPRATRIIPGQTLKSSVKYVSKPTPKRGIPSKVIVPGESFIFPAKKEELLNTAKKTKSEQLIQEKKAVEQIISNLRKSSRKRNSNPSKESVNNKTQRRM